MIRRMPLNQVPRVLNSNEFYAVVARVFVPGAAKDNGVENVMNLWQFKPSSKIMKMPLETVEDTVAYEAAFYDQLERNGRVDEFKMLMAKLESKFDIINLICACDNKYPGDYCHTESLLKLVAKVESVKPEFDWTGEGYVIPEFNIDQMNQIRDSRLRKRARDAKWIANKRSG